MYFGKLAGYGTPSPVLTDVFYVVTQTDPTTKQTKNMLVKRGTELHGPDRMYIRIRDGKSKNARRTLPLTDKAAQMLRSRPQSVSGELVFANRDGGRYRVTSINHLHQKARALVGLGKDFVIHSLRHTMLTRLGESGVDAFTIMRIAGHSSITVSQRYVHPSPEAVERAFEPCSFRGRRGKTSQKCFYRLQNSLQSEEWRS